MPHWFLSYNSQDFEAASRLEAALAKSAPDIEIFLAPKRLRAGSYWQPALAAAIAEADAFVLLVGERGLGPWQTNEYYDAFDRRTKTPGFPLILILLEGVAAPMLSFLGQLHWIITSDPASEHTVAQLLDAAAGGGTRPGELWRHAAPYRGLAAMTEADSDFFFGRSRETAEVLEAMSQARGQLPVLLGNSGVGKSSLAQAGVLAALKRQAWPKGAATETSWPQRFQHSRRWCFLKLQPGTNPLKALIEPFLRTWQIEATDPQWESRQTGWIKAMLSGEATLRGLLDATERRYDELEQQKPPGFFLYIDQGEELYVRAGEQERRRFSEIVADAVGDPRLHALMSLRADFFGDLQKDESLYAVHRQINVPPLRQKELHEIVVKPAEILSARFENKDFPEKISVRTAEESVKDAGALPLLSYLLDDMWSQMVERKDGTLRVPMQAIELGAVLGERGDAFLREHPGQEDCMRRVFTLKLATVREDSEPTRRRALRSEFSEEEWKLVCELADHPHRLLATATPEGGGESCAEVAHEAIFRHWQKLREWITAEREFLAWKSGLEVQRRRWEEAPEVNRKAAMLMGLALTHARGWFEKRESDLSEPDREFIKQSLKRHARNRERLLWAGSAALVLVTAFAVFAGYQWFEAEQQRRESDNNYRVAVDLASGNIRVLSHYEEGGISTKLLAQVIEDAQKAMDRLSRGTPEATAARINLLDVLSLANLSLNNEAARKFAYEANDLVDGLRKTDPRDPQWMKLQARARGRLADALYWGGNPAAALPNAEEAAKLHESLSAAKPDDKDIQKDLMNDYERIGDTRRSLGDIDGANVAYHRWLGIASQAATRYPAEPVWQLQQAYPNQRLGDNLMLLRRPIEARPYYEAYLAIASKLSDPNPGNASFLEAHSISRQRVGDVLLALGQPKGAEFHYRRHLELSQRLFKIDARNFRWREYLAMAHQRLGDFHLQARQHEQALAEFNDYLMLANETLEGNPSNDRARYTVANAHEKIGDALREQNELAKAMAEYSKALEIATRLTSGKAVNPLWLKVRAVAHQRMGLTFELRGDLHDALEQYRQCQSVPVRSLVWDHRTLWPPDVITYCKEKTAALEPKLRPR